MYSTILYPFPSRSLLPMSAEDLGHAPHVLPRPARPHGMSVKKLFQRRCLTSRREGEDKSQISDRFYPPNTPCMPYMPTLTPLAPPQLIGIHGSPMECLGRFHQVVVISSANIGSHQNPQTSDWKNTQVGGSSLHHPAWRFHCLVGMAQPSKEKQPSRLVGKLSQERSDD